MPPSDLYIASEKGNLAEVERLIAAGADVNADVGYGKSTPLYIASLNGQLKIVERLIEAGAEVNKTISNGDTALQAACQSDRFKKIVKKIVERLIASGADVNKANNNGRSPLYTALIYKNIDIFKILINAGADVNAARTDRDYVGDAPIHAASKYNEMAFLEQLISAGADINKAGNEGKTPLYIASEWGYLEIVKKLLDAGADKSIRATNGESPYDVARKEEIANLLKFTAKNSIQWLGWSRGDASMLDGVFGDEETARNFALCPVCMKYVIRKDACMYMSHNCSEQRGYYHNVLYKKYKNSSGIINWCTVCGRICKGHNHFELSSAKSIPLSVIIGKDPFAPSCEGEGGGGVTEKLVRFRRLREHARELQNEVGKMDWWEAMDKLCEEMWNAPIKDVSDIVATMMLTKKFNIPNTNFPLAIPEITNAPNIPFSGQLPIIHPTETAAFTNAMYIDDSNIIQFRHMKADGKTMNNHDGPGQQISREGFVGWLKDVMADPTSFRFGKCWQFKTAAQLTALTAAQKALACDAVLYPEEVKAALDMEDEEQRKLAEGYHKAFNLAMDTRRTIRP